MRPADRLLHDASTALRRISRAKSPGAAEGARRRLEHYLIPDLCEAQGPAVARAVHLAMVDLIERARAERWLPTT